MFKSVAQREPAGMSRSPSPSSVVPMTVSNAWGAPRSAGETSHFGMPSTCFPVMMLWWTWSLDSSVCKEERLQGLCDMDTFTFGTDIPQGGTVSVDECHGFPSMDSLHNRADSAHGSFEFDGVQTPVNESLRETALMFTNMTVGVQERTGDVRDHRAQATMQFQRSRGR